MDKGFEITQATSEAILRQPSGLERFYAELGANVFFTLALIGTAVAAYIIIIGFYHVIIKPILNRRPKVGRPQGGVRQLN